MAVVAHKLTTALQLKHVIGQDKSGKDILKTQKLSGVKTSAVDQDVFDVGKAIGTVFEKGVDELTKVDTTDLTNAGA